MIKVISGIVGFMGEDGAFHVKTSRDGPFSLSKQEEERLVKRGVAGYHNEAGADGAAKPAYSAAMKQGELRELMKAAGIKFKPGMTKEEMAALLDAFYGGAGKEPDGEAIPADDEAKDGEADGAGEPPRPSAAGPVT